MIFESRHHPRLQACTDHLEEAESLDIKETVTCSDNLCQKLADVTMLAVYRLGIELPELSELGNIR